jgi:hypothetical protein
MQGRWYTQVLEVIVFELAIIELYLTWSIGVKYTEDNIEQKNRQIR